MRWHVVLGVAWLMVLGCGKSDRLPTHPTSGTVRYQDGAPIEEGSLMFVCEGLPPGRGLIEAGKFEIGTYEQRDGAVAGIFQVGVQVSPPIDYDPDSGKPPVGARAKYARPDTSGLQFEVVEGGSNRFEIILERGK